MERRKERKKKRNRKKVDIEGGKVEKIRVVHGWNSRSLETVSEMINHVTTKQTGLETDLVTYLGWVICLISHHYYNLSLKISQSRGSGGLSKCTVFEERLVKRDVNAPCYLTTMKSEGRGNESRPHNI